MLDNRAISPVVATFFLLLVVVIGGVIVFTFLPTDLPNSSITEAGVSINENGEQVTVQLDTIGDADRVIIKGGDTQVAILTQPGDEYTFNPSNQVKIIQETNGNKLLIRTFEPAILLPSSLSWTSEAD